MIPSGELSIEEKMDLLRTCFKKAGPSPAMTDLIKQLAADKIWGAKPEVQALQKEYGQTAAGSDRYLSVYAALMAVQKNAPNVVRRPVTLRQSSCRSTRALFRGTAPTGPRRSSISRRRKPSRPMWTVWGAAARPSSPGPSCGPRAVGRGTAWTDKRQGILGRLTQDEPGRDAMYRSAGDFALLQGNDPGDPAVWDLLSGANYPNDGKPIVLAAQYGRMGEAAARFVWRQTSNTKYNGPSIVLELDKVVNLPGFEFKDVPWWNGISDWLGSNWVGRDHKKVPASLSRALLKYQMAEAAKTGQPDIGRSGRDRLAIRRRAGGRRHGPVVGVPGGRETAPARPAAGNLCDVVRSDGSAGRSGGRAHAGDAISHALDGAQAALRAGARREMVRRAHAARRDRGGQEGGGQVQGQTRVAGVIAVRDLLRKMIVAGAGHLGGQLSAAGRLWRGGLREQRSTRRTGARRCG